MRNETVAAQFERLKAASLDLRLTSDLAARRRALGDLRACIQRREPEILAALRADFGKPDTETLLTEILPVLQDIRLAQRQLPKWMRPKRAGFSMAAMGTSGRIRPEPRGLCLIIAPWNYPFNLALSPLVSCIAAGNTAIVKPSELAPATSALIASIVAECLPADLVTVIEGGVEISTALLAQPFDHIFFTGSPEVGKIVMTAAAKHLTSVTLELGGKSPTIIGPTADIARAADWVVFGKFTNAGQTCIAPDHLFVHRSRAEEFTKLLQARIAKAYGGAGSGMARIISDRHADRLRGMLSEAVTQGGRVLTGGAGNGREIPPTLIEAVVPQMQLDQDEIFGPILPIYLYDDLQEVIDKINARPKPLALYVFDKSSEFSDAVIRATSSGGVGVNLTLLHYTHHGLPFGGVNHSGHGAAHGEWGFRAFSHERAILRNRFSVLPMIFAPFTPVKKRLIGAAMRLLG